MKDKVIPIMCPICHNPICTNIGYNCNIICVGNKDDRCLQKIKSGTCHCTRSEIVNRLISKYPLLFNSSDDYSTNNEAIKRMIVKIKFEKDEKILNVEELFKEIEL